MYMDENDLSSYTSLEAIHDIVHVTVGGNGGNMQVIPVSAFDPAFWLHHAMVDRCFAIWQALYPDQYMDAVHELAGTFTVEPGAIENASSPLTPFHSDSAGDFWTPDSSRNLTTFGYTYPELQNAKNVSDVVEAITDLYGPSTTLSQRRSLVPESRASLRNASMHEAQTSTKYIVNILADAACIPGSFQIFVLSNLTSCEAEENGSLLASKPLTLGSLSQAGNLLGYHAFFGSSSASLQPSTMDGKITAAIPITSSLQQALRRAELPMTGPAYVAALLEDGRIGFLVADMAGDRLGSQQGADVSATLVSANVTAARRKGEMPIWGALVEMGAIPDFEKSE